MSEQTERAIGWAFAMAKMALRERRQMYLNKRNAARQLQDFGVATCNEHSAEIVRGCINAINRLQKKLKNQT